MIEQTHSLGEGVGLYVLLSALVVSSVGLSAYSVRITNLKGVTNLMKSHNSFGTGCSFYTATENLFRSFLQKFRPRNFPFLSTFSKC